MSWLFWAILIFATLLLGGIFARSVFRNPCGDFESGIAFLLGRCYVKLVHHLRIHHPEHIPAGSSPGPLIVVANHTAGVDPILIQATCPFKIRWIMASDMRAPGLEWFWKWQRVIFVGRDRNSTTIGLRDAINYLNQSGVVGIFPEGGLERPPGHILPFQSGLGMLVRKTGAPVLPIFIEGTPQVDPAWASLWHPSRSQLHFGPKLHLNPEDSSTAIAEQVRNWIVTHSGWPTNDDPKQVEIESGKTMSPYGTVKPANAGPDERSVA